MLYGLENTQPETAKVLEELLKSGDFPASVLFSGPSCSGRMFAAMCVAKFYGADTDSTVIVSDRNHSYRIATALKLFKKSKNKSSAQFLEETVSTYLKQFHGALMDSMSQASKRKFSDAAECMDLLEQLKDVDEKDADEFVKKFEKSISELIDLGKAPSAAKTGTVSVGQVRAIRDWCRTSSLDGKAKIVIIEGLENAGPSSANALLKILEEPPLDTHFILISESATRIPATVLSRVRLFKFKAFTDTEKKYVLNRLFVDPSLYSDLEDFFLINAGVDDKLLKSSAACLVNKQDFDLPALVKELEKTGAWNRYFELVLDCIADSYKNGNISYRLCRALTSEINTMVSKAGVYNQTPRLTFDFVTFRTKEYLA